MGFFNGLFKTEYFNSTNQFVGFDEFDHKKFTDEDLINKGYANNSDVYSIIKLLSTVAANVPLLLTENSTGEEEIITDGDVYQAFNMPSEGTSQVEFIEQSFTYLLASGDLYYLKESAVGFVSPLLKILPSGLIDIQETNSIFTPPTTYLLEDFNKQRKISAEDIIHIKYVDPSTWGLRSWKGLSPLSAAKLSMTSSSDIQKANSVMVKNQGARGILTNRSDRAMSPEEKHDMQKVANDRIMGVKNFNKIFATTGNVDYKAIGMSSSDLKLIESGLVTLRQLCNAYGISSRLLNDPANTTFNNVFEAEKSLFTRAIFPSLENKIIWTLNQTWMKEFSDRDNKDYKIKIDKSAIEVLQKDQLAETQKNNSIAQSLLAVLKEDITNEQKVQILISAYSLSEEEAKNIVGNEQ